MPCKRLCASRSIAWARGWTMQMTPSAIVASRPLCGSSRRLAGTRQLRVVELAALLGVSPDQLSPQLQSRVLPAAHAGLPANASIDLMARRPDIAASRWRVEAVRAGRIVHPRRVLPRHYPACACGCFQHRTGHAAGPRFMGAEHGCCSPPAAVRCRTARRATRGGRAQLAEAVARYNETVVGAAREVGAAARRLSSRPHSAAARPAGASQPPP